jgi:hypothetical protein
MMMVLVFPVAEDEPTSNVLRRACVLSSLILYDGGEKSRAGMSYLQPKLKATFAVPRQDSNEPQNTRENRGIQGQGGTDSGTPADAGKMEALAAALLSLSPADRERLAAMLTGQGG